MKPATAAPDRPSAATVPMPGTIAVPPTAAPAPVTVVRYCCPSRSARRSGLSPGCFAAMRWMFFRTRGRWTANTVERAFSKPSVGSPFSSSADFSPKSFTFPDAYRPIVEFFAMRATVSARDPRGQDPGVAARRECSRKMRTSRTSSGPVPCRIPG